MVTGITRALVFAVIGFAGLTISFAQAPADPKPAPAPEAQDPAAIWKASDAAFRAGDFEKADKLFTEFVEGFGNDERLQKYLDQLLPLRALAKVRLKKFADAIPLIRQSLKLQEIEPKVREELAFWLGLCQMQRPVTDGEIEEKKEAHKFWQAQKAFGEFYANEKHATNKRHEALILYGVCNSLMGDHDDAVVFYQQRLPKLRKDSPEAAARVTVLLLYAQLERGALDESLQLVVEQYKQIDEVTQIISFQSLVLDLGARFLDAQEYHKAIACLQRVWKRDRLLKHQVERLEELKRKLDILKARGGYEDYVFQFDGMVRRTEREIENFRKIENFDAALRLRLAVAFQGLGRYREAGLIIEDMMVKMPADEIIEGAGMTLIQCWLQVENWTRAVKAADLFAERFPESKQLPTMLFLKGRALQSDTQWDEADQIYEELLETFPGAEVAPRAALMRGMVALSTDRNVEAMRFFDAVSEKFPQHEVAEDAFYWVGMAHSFHKEYSASREQMGAYLAKYSGGRYQSDAAFRRAFALQAMADYEEAIVELRDFIRDWGEASSYTDEARLLLGDALFAVGELEQGIASFKQISPQSTKFFEDGWFKIGKALRLQEKVKTMRGHFEEFVTSYPESRRMAEAVYWIGWTHSSSGDEESARKIYWETIEKHGDEPELFGMADIMLALKKLYPGADGRRELVAAFEGIGRKAKLGDRDTLTFRAGWAAAQVLRIDLPDSADQPLLDAAKFADVEIHNPLLLADCADALRADGKTEQAEAMYRGLRKWNPRAVQKDRAYAGLGFIAAEAGDVEEALKYFDRFEEEMIISPLFGEVLLARAGLYREVRENNLAKASLEKLLAEKTVPTRVKAQALFEYADLLSSEGNDLKAVAYWERVYLAYGRYPQMVADAYWLRGQALERMKRSGDALKVYEEFVSREDLADYEQFAKAQARIAQLGKGGSQ